MWRMALQTWKKNKKNCDGNHMVSQSIKSHVGYLPVLIAHDITGGLSQEGQSSAEGGPPVTVGGPLAKTQKKVKKW